MGVASRRWTNPKTVVFTPTSGSAIPITGITGITVNSNATAITASGDGDRYMTLNRPIGNDITVQVTGTDAVKLISLIGTVMGVLTWVTEDAKNADGTGAASWTLINASAFSPTGNFAHQQVSNGTCNFISESTDGTTNPLSYVLTA